MEWKTKIVKSGMMIPEQLLANEKNWRIHPRFQQDTLLETLERVGWVQDVIVNLRRGEEWGADRGVETLVDGHLRVQLALRHGQDAVPVKYVDLSPDEERLILLTLDPIAGLAAADSEKLAELLDGIEVDEGALSELMMQLEELAGIAEKDEEKDEPEEENYEEKWMIVVECEDEMEQIELLERLAEEGLHVRALLG